jgi:hypothetical protein
MCIEIKFYFCFMDKPLIKIFRSGTHTASNGEVVTYTEQDLTKIVEEYNSRSSETKYYAPIIGGDHNKAGKKALGFVEKLIKKGSEIFGSILPSPELIDDVRNNRYRYVSSGFNKQGGFDHVAVLGAVKPAIKDLGMIAFSEEELDSITKFDIKQTIFNYSEVTMDPRLQALREQIQKYILEKYGNDIVVDIMAEFDRQLTVGGLDQAQAPQAPQQAPAFGTQPQQNPIQQRFATQFGQQFSESEEGQKLIADFEKQARRINELEFTAYLEKEKSKILPANINIALELMQSLSEQGTNFSENGQTITGIDLFKKFVNNLPKAIDTSDVARKELAFSESEDKELEEVKKIMRGDK